MLSTNNTLSQAQLAGVNTAIVLCTFLVLLHQLVLNCWTRKLSKQAETKRYLESLINMYAGYRCTQRTQDPELVVSAYNSASANPAAAI